MRLSEPSRYLLASGALALAVGLGVAWVAADHAPGAMAWALLGWGLTASIGVAGGAWLVCRHGQPGAGFIVALGTCMLARLFASAAGAWWASRTGVGAIWAFVGGLTAGFIALQAFEITWFVRHGVGPRAGDGE